MGTTRQPSHERRKQIVDAALHIISTQGVHRLTTATLAEEVGISEGAIFRHFRNKEEIIDTAIDTIEGLLFANLPPIELPPLVRLRAFFLQRLELLRQSPAVVRLASSERLIEAAGESSAVKVQRLVERSQATVRECLMDAQTNGEIASDIPVPVLIWMVLGVLRSAAMATAFSGSNGEKCVDVPPLITIGVPVGLTIPPSEQVWEGVEKLLLRSVSH